MPAYVQSASANGSTATTNIPYGSANTVGNLLVFAARIFNNANVPVVYTVTDSKGNTWTKAPNGINPVHGITAFDLWYVPSCLAGANTVTLTITNPGAGPSPQICILEYSGVVTSPLVVLTSSASVSVAGTAYNSGNIITAQNVELLIGVVANDTANSLVNTPAGGWTARVNSVGLIFVCDQITSSSGTYAFSGSLSSSVMWMADIAGFQSGGFGSQVGAFCVGI
jgi:hypothetical protein